MGMKGSKDKRDSETAVMITPKQLADLKRLEKIDALSTLKKKACLYLANPREYQDEQYRSGIKHFCEQADSLLTEEPDLRLERHDFFVKVGHQVFSFSECVRKVKHAFKMGLSQKENVHRQINSAALASDPTQAHQSGSIDYGSESEVDFDDTDDADFDDEGLQADASDLHVTPSQAVTCLSNYPQTFYAKKHDSKMAITQPLTNADDAESGSDTDYFSEGQDNTDEETDYFTDEADNGGHDDDVLGTGVEDFEAVSNEPPRV